MTKMRLTAFSILISGAIILLASCRRDDVEHQNTWQKNGLVLSGAQETPATPTSATGTMDVNYSRLARTLFYTVRWTGLTGPVTGMHIHGLNPAGFSSPNNVFQSFTLGNIVPCKVNNVPGPTSCGTYTGSLYIDGVAINEMNLLNGLYYVNIHSATYPGGEIRGQIKFQ